MSTILYLGARVFHVLFASLWIGSSVFISALLMPAIDNSGPSGGQVMARMNRHGMHVYMTVFGSTTVVSGLYLLWRFTGGFDPSVTANHAGLAYCVGGLAGILAAVIGSAVVGRSASQAATVMGQMAALPEGPARGALMATAASLRQRMRTGSRVAIALQAIALVLMTVGHYV